MWVIISQVTRSLKARKQSKLALLQAICSWCPLNLNHEDISKRKHFHLICNPRDRKSWHPEKHLSVMSTWQLASPFEISKQTKNLNITVSESCFLKLFTFNTAWMKHPALKTATKDVTINFPQSCGQGEKKCVWLLDLRFMFKSSAM